jgi:phosphoribosylformimino-5-aminoimidazole carboxamide ribotide isomerase
VSPLAATSAPREVLRGLLGLAAFPTVYVADLDAIAGTGDHRAAMESLREEAPGIEIWLDGGFPCIAAVPPGVVPVLGSESLVEAANLAEARCVLSLDYKGGRFLGPAAVENNPELWPDRVILMTLDRVGGGAGPDLAGLAALKRRAGGRAVFAAGGTRHEGDIAALRQAGIAGALVASALHDGSLPGPVLQRCLGG